VFPKHWPRLQEEMRLPAPLVAPHVVYPARARRFYAVAVGRRPRIDKSWYEAAEHVGGFGGNVHRALSTKAEAEFFLRQKRNQQ
jgi:hypothetical protein